MMVTIIGAGHVGLNAALTLAFVGHLVWVVDSNEHRVSQLFRGSVPFHEPHAEEMLGQCASRLEISSGVAEAAGASDVVIVAVGTPSLPDCAPELSQVHAALEAVLSNPPKGNNRLVVVNKRTVPVGTGDEMAQITEAKALRRRVRIASNPEFLRQERALSNSLHPDRVVLGGPHQGTSLLEELYRPILDQSFTPPASLPRPRDHNRVSANLVDRKSADLAKYAANALLAARICFINEVAHVCDRVGADIDAVRDIAGADLRIGSHFLRAGIGYGGSCFPRDTRALHHIATTNGYDFNLLSAVIRVNQTQQLQVVDKVTSTLGVLRRKRIALLGLALKPYTGDMREAPSIHVAETLVANGGDVLAHDPRAVGAAAKILPPKFQLCQTVQKALRGAVAAILPTEWPEYLSLDKNSFQSLVRRPLVIDGRNALGHDVRVVTKYPGIGRRSLV